MDEKVMDDKELNFENKEVVDLLDSYYDDYSAFMNEVNETSILRDYVISALRKGESSLSNNTILEEKDFDYSWIEVLEKYLPSLEHIFKQPKTTIKYENDIVPIEKARKVNSESIRHLSSHSHFIKDIKDDEVIPGKIQTTFAEDNLATYENRFAVTLVNRLYLFILRRKQVIEEQKRAYKKDRLVSKKEFSIQGTSIDVTIDFAIKSPTRRKQELIEKALERINMIEIMILNYRATALFKELKHMLEIRSPIMKTNIILKNPDFRNAHIMWLFLERYNSLGFDIQVKESKNETDDLFKEDLEKIVFLTFTAFMHHQARHNIRLNQNLKYKTKKLKRDKKLDVDNINALPGRIQLEDNGINEFFLNQTKNYFKQEYETLKKDGATYEQTIRNIYKQMLHIANSAYQEILDSTKKDDSEFHRLNQKSVKELNDLLKDVKKRAKILSEVKAVKLQDLKELEKEEEREQRLIYKIQDALDRIRRGEEYDQLKADKEIELKELNALAKKKALEELNDIKKKQRALKELERLQAAHERAHLKRLKDLEKANNQQKEKLRIQLEKELGRITSDNAELTKQIEVRKNEVDLLSKAKVQEMQALQEQCIMEMHKMKEENDLEIARRLAAINSEEQGLNEVFSKLEADYEAIVNEAALTKSALEEEMRINSELIAKLQQAKLEDANRCLEEERNKIEIKQAQLEQVLSESKYNISIDNEKKVKISEENKNMQDLIDMYQNIEYQQDIDPIQNHTKNHKHKKLIVVDTKSNKKSIHGDYANDSTKISNKHTVADSNGNQRPHGDNDATKTSNKHTVADSNGNQRPHGDYANDVTRANNKHIVADSSNLTRTNKKLMIVDSKDNQSSSHIDSNELANQVIINNKKKRSAIPLLIVKNSEDKDKLDQFFKKK